MEIYDRNPEARLKDDRSPVTEADTVSEAYILAELAKLCPEIPIVSEEAASEGKIPEVADLFFLVDPLDGTREFLSRNGEFTVNIGLIANGLPAAGIIYTPASGRMFRGQVGQGAEQAEVACSGSLADAHWQPITVRAAQQGNLIAVASRSHRDERTNAYLEEHGVSETKSAGSSLKFCLLAAGEADLYPRMGRTMEWDTAAGHAVLHGAGGRVVRFDDHTELKYGKDGYANPFFIAYSPAVALKPA
ncbi:MAG: 3'(2'),5'-bisphosphate nucleotidase CysQ [Rhizobiales bacterium]|nr:3'(2'),5'-bisphosphate nucleotidase CysQ [Hyphomicrobiales bacterium]